MTRVLFDVVLTPSGEPLSVGDPTPGGEGHIIGIDRESDAVDVMTPNGPHGYRAAALGLQWGDWPAELHSESTRRRLAPVLKTPPVRE